MSRKSKRSNSRWLYEAQEGVCAICSGYMEHPDHETEGSAAEKPLSPTIDHIKPSVNGGTWLLENLLLVHKICNERKDWRALPKSAAKIRMRVLGQVQKLRQAERTAIAAAKARRQTEPT